MAQLRRPFSVSAIYSRVLSRLETLDPSQLTLNGSRIAHAIDYTHTQAAAPGGLLVRRPRIEYRRTPVHFVIVNRLHHSHH